MTPLFSIVTVCLNAGQELKSTVESLHEQSCCDYEHIVKDGGSIDGCNKFILNNDQYTKVKYHSEPDGGIYDAMNQALKYCTGKYILFLNAGDVFYDNMVLEQIYGIANPDNSPDLIYSDYTTTQLLQHVKSPAKLTDSYLYRTMLCHQVCFIKRELYFALGEFDTGYQVVADYDFLLKLIVDNRATYKYVPLVSVVSLSGGYSSHNHQVAMNEVQLLRGKYFPGFIGRYYSFLYALTLPKVRIFIMRRSDMYMLRRIYTYLANIYNK